MGLWGWDCVGWVRHSIILRHSTSLFLSDGRAPSRSPQAATFAPSLRGGVRQVAVLLWAGTFQFCTLNHRLSAFTFTVWISRFVLKCVNMLVVCVVAAHVHALGSI